ncbi:MAG: GNAT family N-acetyltransferase [Eubacteriales bacterium]|nr:GNAT family N-acetyltransferase [Eubacteriales bacterium]
MATIRPLTAADKQEAMEIWELRFNDSLSFIDWFFTERFAPDTSFCAEEDGRIISIAHGFVMQLRIRGVVLPAMMVSGVATLPGYEGHGLMKRVLFELFSECRRRSIPLAFHKPSHFSIYRAIGEFPCYDALFHTRETEPSSPVLWDCVPLYDELLRVYEQATSRYSGCVVRSHGDIEKRVHDLTIDGARCLVHRTGGIADGYLFASEEADGSLYCEETLATSVPAYEDMVSRLPKGSVVKLPPDIPLSGEIRPWGVVIPIDVSYLLRALCGDAAVLSLSVLDDLLPWNRGIFDGAGNRTSSPFSDTLSVGRLMQFLCGYLPFQRVFSQEICYCADEY